MDPEWKKVGSIGKEEIMMLEKPVQNMKKHRSYMFTSKTSVDNKKKSTQHAEGIDYEQFKEFLEKNFKKKKNRKYMINVITDLGSKSTGKVRDDFDYYDEVQEYGDKGRPTEIVYAIQIIEIG